MKNNNYRNLIAIAFLVFSTGCSSDPLKNKEVEFDGFQNEYQLKSEVVEWLDIWSCGDLRIYDTVLVAIDWKREKLFHVYNLDSKKLIGSFGNYGKGPGEFFTPPELTPVFYYEGKDLIFQICDWGRRTLLNINLRKSILETKVINQSTYELPDFFLSSKLFMTEDSKIYSVDHSVLQIYDPAINEAIKSHEPIGFAQELSDKYMEIGRIMYLEMPFHQDHIVGSFNVLQRLHVYNKNGELLKVIKKKGNHIFDTNEKYFYANNNVYFSKTFLSNDYILVLNENRKIGTVTCGELLLFNYEGDALIKYKLDCWISNGAVDWKSKTLYTYNYEEGTMISFKLTEIGK